MGSPSVNSYFLLSRPERSGSPPNKAAPDIVPQAPAEENPTPIREHVDFFRAAINILGTDNGTKDVSLADIYPKQVNKMDILSLGLPKLSTGIKLCMLHFVVLLYIFFRYSSTESLSDIMSL
jgi:hypothetical protein